MMYLVPALDFADTGIPPVNTVAPVVSGTTVVGQSLSCTTGTWTGDPTITYSYQWKRGVTNVGTNSNTYTLVSADISFNISCVVTATNAEGSVNQSSNSVGPVKADIRVRVGTSTSPTSSAPNLLTFTEQLDNGAWVYFGFGSKGSTGIADPVGGAAADSVVFSANATDQVYQTVSISNATTYTASVWARVASGTKAVRFKIYNGSSDQFSSDLTVTTTWTRISATFTTTGSGMGNFALANGSTATSGTVEFYGVQLELSASATSYTAHPPRKAVTGVGFQPKVVLPFATFLPAAGTGTASLLSLGAAVSTSSRAAIGVNSGNGVTTSSTYRQHSAAKFITGPNDASATTVIDADLSSLDADGFTGNWSTVLSPARILNHICLGGADLEVSLVQCTMNGTNAAQSFAHGLSGAPTGILFLGVVEANASPVTSTSLYLSIGAWANNNQQFVARVTSLSNLTTSQTFRALHTNGVAGWLNMSGAQRTMKVSSVNATNVNVTYPVTTSNYQEVFWMLAVRGAKCQVGTFDCNGSTSPLTISTTGITPKLFLPVFVPNGVDGINTVQTDGLFLSIGASDGTNNVSCGITDQNGTTTTNARRYQSSSALVEYDQNSNLRLSATAAFSGESVVVTPATNASVFWGQGGYLVIGS